jgi:signal transduction histidine kinase
MQLELAPVELAPIAKATLKSFESSAHTDNIALVAETSPDLPLVLADAGTVQRVLSNLVDNALKFTPAQGRVAIGTRVAEGMMQVWVADSGPGIPYDVRAHLFEKFTQIKGRTGKRRGTGLGLAFCKLAMEAHGGRIWVECPPEGGSMFIFTLPLAG